MDDNEYEDDYPCYDCPRDELCCDVEAKFCCALCKYLGGSDCDNCEPMDI